METKITRNVFGQHTARLTMGILMVLSVVLVFPYILPRAHAASTPVSSESTITVSTEDIVVDAKVLPDGSSSFHKASSNLSIKTNNYSGYTLRIVAEDGDTYNKLINSAANTFLESITEATSEQDFKDEASFLGKFGYSPSKLASSDNTDFLPAPDTTGDVLDVTSAANFGEGEENTYTISLGAKVDMSIIAGEYVNTYIYEVVANPTPYLITYDENTTDTVANMPSAQEDDTSSDGIVLDGTTPERDHYDFIGWCEGTTTNTVTEQDDVYTCDGTIYQPGDTFYLDQTTGNQVELKAMWEIHKYRLDLNGKLNDANANNINDYGTVDVYINGNQVADDVSDYATYWKYGTAYEITDIKAAANSQYDGVASGSLTGTITDASIDLRLIFYSTYTVQLVTTNGSGAATQTIKYGTTTTFTNVKPNSNYNDTNSISCTNSQTATKSGITVTTGAITNNTVCTVSFPIKTYTVQLVTTNGSGATSKTVNHGSTTSFTNVKPNTNYNDTNTISCTNSQTASKSGTTVTTGAITNNTVCTISFPIKTYSVKLVVNGGSGGTTKTVNHGSTTTFSVSASAGYSYSSLSCTASQTASISGNTVTTGAITAATTCTLTYTDQTRPSAPSIVYGIHSLRVQASSTITFKIIVKSSDSSGSNITYYIHDKTNGTSFGTNTCANNTNCTLNADTGLTASAKNTWHDYEICARDASNNLICSALIGSWTAQRFYIHQLYGGFRAIWGNTYNVNGSEITLHLDALSSKNTAHMIKGMYGQTEPTNFYNGLNTTQKCENLYHAILGRASDSGGLTNCINNINGGRTFQSIATEMANSAEGQAIYSALGFPTGTTPLP